MNKNLIIVLLGVTLAPAGVKAAGNGNVNFTGRLVNQTCNVAVNGGSSDIINLPAVQKSVLASAGDVAGTTSFKMVVTGCVAPPPNGSGSGKVYFEAGPYVNSDGRLVNATSVNDGGASNVSLQLIDNSLKTPIKIGDESQAQTKNVANTYGYQTLVKAGGTFDYSVQYYATGQATAGSVTSSVTYTMVYW